MPLRKEEINRKLLHILSGSVIPLCIFYMPWIEGADWRLPSGILGATLVVLVVIEVLRMRVPAVQRFWYSLAGKAMREHEAAKTTGATYIVASSFICSVMFYRRPEIAVMSLSVFILGDAVAALVGQTMGRTKIGPKSLEGSIGCFVLCVLMFLFVFPYLPGMLDTWRGRVPLLVVAAASLCTTVLELFPIHLPGGFEINDNLTVPPLTGLLLWWLHGLIGVAA